MFCFSDAERRQRSRSIRREVRRRREQSAGPKFASDPNLSRTNMPINSSSTSVNTVATTDAEKRIAKYKEERRRHLASSVAQRLSAASSSSDEEDQSSTRGRYKRRRRKREDLGGESGNSLTRSGKNTRRRHRERPESPEHIYQKIGSDLSVGEGITVPNDPVPPPLPPQRNYLLDSEKTGKSSKKSPVRSSDRTSSERSLSFKSRKTEAPSPPTPTPRKLSSNSPVSSSAVHGKILYN